MGDANFSQYMTEAEIEALDFETDIWTQTLQPDPIVVPTSPVKIKKDIVLSPVPIKEEEKKVKSKREQLVKTNSESGGKIRKGWEGSRTEVRSKTTPAPVTNPITFDRHGPKQPERLPPRKPIEPERPPVNRETLRKRNHEDIRIIKVETPKEIKFNLKETKKSVNWTSQPLGSLSRNSITAHHDQFESYCITKVLYDAVDFHIKKSIPEETCQGFFTPNLPNLPYHIRTDPIHPQWRLKAGHLLASLPPESHLLQVLSSLIETLDVFFLSDQNPEQKNYQEALIDFSHKLRTLQKYSTIRVPEMSQMLRVKFQSDVSNFIESLRWCLLAAEGLQRFKDFLFLLNIKNVFLQTFPGIFFETLQDHQKTVDGILLCVRNVIVKFNSDSSLTNYPSIPPPHNEFSQNSELPGHRTSQADNLLTYQNSPSKFVISETLTFLSLIIYNCPKRMLECVAPLFGTYGILALLDDNNLSITSKIELVDFLNHLAISPKMSHLFVKDQCYSKGNAFNCLSSLLEWALNSSEISFDQLCLLGNSVLDFVLSVIVEYPHYTSAIFSSYLDQKAELYLLYPLVAFVLQLLEYQESISNDIILDPLVDAGDDFNPRVSRPWESQSISVTTLSFDLQATSTSSTPSIYPRKIAYTVQLLELFLRLLHGINENCPYLLKSYKFKDWTRRHPHKEKSQSSLEGMNLYKCLLVALEKLRGTTEADLSMPYEVLTKVHYLSGNSVPRRDGNLYLSPLINNLAKLFLNTISMLRLDE